MSINEYLIALAFVFIFIDFFIMSDITTFVSYIIFTYVLTTYIEVHYLYKIIVGIIFWFALVAFHYLLWKKVMIIILNKYICKDKYIVSTECIGGKKGVVKIIDGQKRGVIEDVLYEFDKQNNLSEGDSFIVSNIKDGKIEL